MTTAIRSWMAKPSPGPRTCACPFGRGSSRKLRIGGRDVEPDRGPDGDDDDAPDEPVAQLAEVVDQRHDRSLGHAGTARRRDGVSRDDAGGRFAKGVGVGHQGRGAPDLVRVGSRLARGGGRSLGRGRGRSRGRDRGDRRNGRFDSRRRDGSRRGRRRGRQRRCVDVDLTESLRSDDALRNSRMLLPMDAPTSGSLPGPRISNAMTRMMMSSGAPMFGMSADPFVHRAAARVAQGAVEPTRAAASAIALTRVLFGEVREHARDAARHVDQQPAARPACTGPGARGAMLEDRLDGAALGADPGHEERQTRGDAADRRELLGCRRTDHETDGAARSPAGREPRDPLVERLGLRRLGGVVADEPAGPGARRRPGSMSGRARRRSGPRARAAVGSPPRRGTG